MPTRSASSLGPSVYGREFGRRNFQSVLRAAVTSPGQPRPRGLANSKKLKTDKIPKHHLKTPSIQAPVDNADVPAPLPKNPSCRVWFGRESLRVRDIGAWGGKSILRPVGAREGRYDTKFVKWCMQHKVLFIRTVDLFWLFEYYRDGFYQKIDARKLRQRWEEAKSFSRSTHVYLPTDIRDANGYPKLRLMNSVELREWRKQLDPGSWRSYYRFQKAHFQSQTARYKHALTFWRTCSQQGRETFLLCTVQQKTSRRPPRLYCGSS